MTPPKTQIKIKREFSLFPDTDGPEGAADSDANEAVEMAARVDSDAR